ncbi:MAG: hypothetical protein KGK12_05445 [Armatimonadetes bacterium]|nr:hypothetical protein [Armatimonadota bacterium]
MRTRSITRYRRQSRVQRQASERLAASLSHDQRRIIELAAADYAPGEIARELALETEFVSSFMTSLSQRLTQQGLIPSSESRHLLHWATSMRLIN